MSAVDVVVGPAISSTLCPSQSPHIAQVTSSDDQLHSHEVDILDEHDSSYHIAGQEIPPRPISRLGFNRIGVSEDLSPQTPEPRVDSKIVQSETVSRYNSCPSMGKKTDPTITVVTANRSIISSDMDYTERARLLESSTPPKGFKAKPGINIRINTSVDHCSTPVLPFDSDDDSDELDSDCSSCGDSDEEFNIPLDPRPPLRCRNVTSISRLCFPFVTTPTPRRAPSPRLPPPPPPLPPVRRKFSNLPSPLSLSDGRSPNFSCVIPPRYNYGQHGYSRHSLMHVKWFWSCRQGGWDDHGDTKRSEGVYGDMSAAEVAIGTHSLANSPQDPHSDISYPALSHDQLPPLTIHPRRGDISALRDPFCTHIDRLFVGMPSWTIGKTLWIHDMHLAMESRNYPAADQHDRDSMDFDGAESESESIASCSGISGDDSDATLVETDSEAELTYDSCGSEEGCVANGRKRCLENLYYELSPTRAMVGSSSHTGSTSEDDMNTAKLHVPTFSPKLDWKRVTYNDPPSPPLLSKSGYIKPPWVTDWYRRWDLLVHLSCRNNGHDDNAIPNLNSRVGNESKSGCLPEGAKSIPMFLSGDSDESDSDIDGDEVWNEVVETANE